MANDTQKAAWSDDQWAAYINAPEANPVLAIIERGKRLKERRDSCDQRGDRSNTFEAFLQTHVGMKPAMGSRFVAIGAKAEVFHAVKDSLPPSVGTLYELTHLTGEQFRDAVDAGLIHSEMTRADAEALRGVRKVQAVKFGPVPGKESSGNDAAASDGGSPSGSGLAQALDVLKDALNASADRPIDTSNIKVTKRDASAYVPAPVTKPTSEHICNQIFLALSDIEEVGEFDATKLRERIKLLKPDALRILVKVLSALIDDPSVKKLVDKAAGSGRGRD